MKPHALVTNDDGIESGFLHCLVDALRPHFRISVAAPAREQSWTGRSMTRHGEIAVTPSDSVFSPDVEAWAIGGTPTDCVNIAMGNLLPTRPDIVLSGINVGFNTCDTLILSSGTVAGAIEGALWDLPAIAFSQCVPGELFQQISGAKGHTEGAFGASIKASACRAAYIALETLDNSATHIGKVININFPVETNAATPVVETFPAKLKLGGLFGETSPGKYAFRYSDGIVTDPAPNSDRAALARGQISRSILDFSKIGEIASRPQE